jgi:hypothetical protein
MYLGTENMTGSDKKLCGCCFFTLDLSLALKESETGFKELLSRGTFFLVTD